MQQKLNFPVPDNANITENLHRRRTNIQTHVLPSFFDSPVPQSARRLYSLPSLEGGLNIKEPIDYEMEYAASLSACAPLEYGDRAIVHLTQERIKHDQRTARLNFIQSSKKDLMENRQSEQHHVIEMASEKEALNGLTALPLKR